MSSVGNKVFRQLQVRSSSEGEFNNNNESRCCLLLHEDCLFSYGAENNDDLVTLGKHGKELRLISSNVSSDGLHQTNENEFYFLE
jgi:hypothetical protein